MVYGCFVVQHKNVIFCISYYHKVSVFRGCGFIYTLLQPTVTNPPDLNMISAFQGACIEVFHCTLEFCELNNLIGIAGKCTCVCIHVYYVYSCMYMYMYFGVLLVLCV